MAHPQFRDSDPVFVDIQKLQSFCDRIKGPEETQPSYEQIAEGAKNYIHLKTAKNVEESPSNAEWARQGDFSVSALSRASTKKIHYVTLKKMVGALQKLGKFDPKLNPENFVLERLPDQAKIANSIPVSTEDVKSESDTMRKEVALDFKADSNADSIPRDLQVSQTSVNQLSPNPMASQADGLLEHPKKTAEREDRSKDLQDLSNQQHEHVIHYLENQRSVDSPQALDDLDEKTDGEPSPNMPFSDGAQNLTIRTKKTCSVDAQEMKPRAIRANRALALLGLGSLFGIFAMATLWYANYDGQTATLETAIPEADVTCKLFVSRDGEPATPFLDAEIPLRPGDGVKVLVESVRANYIYAFWLDASGNVESFWPGNLLTSKQKNESRDKPRKRLTIPDPDSDAQFLTLKNDMSGVHAIVVLIRTTPLPSNVDIKNNLRPLPQPKRSRAEFDSIAIIVTRDEIIRANNRSPIRNGDQHRVDDPIQHIERITASQASGIAGFTRAFLFSFEGQ